MNFSRRWFLKTAVMTAIAANIPIVDDRHRVLFIDGGPVMVENYIRDAEFIRAKVVNGAWDLVIDTKKKMKYAYSNPIYGIDIISELKDSTPYSTLTEVRVSSSIGEVTDELKPRTVMVGKWEEAEDYLWENGNPVLDAMGAPVMIPILKPVMVEQTTVYKGEPHMVYDQWTDEWYDAGDGTITLTSMVQAEEPFVIDPLHGAGVDYNAVIAAAR